MFDFLIVGCGLGGISFAETALNNNKSIVVIDNSSQNSSRIAGGLYNPVILKRFSEVAGAKDYLQSMHSFYDVLESKMDCQFRFELPIYRRFFSFEEQNNWFSASDKVNLAPYLSTKILYPKYDSISSPFGFGQVLLSGYVDTALVLDRYRSFLLDSNLLRFESFQFDELVIGEESVQYKDISAKHVVFSEGFGLHSNPFFNYLPLDGTKGELLIIKAPLLNLDVILNTSLFFLPLGNDLYKVGATYHWEDKSSMPTADGRLELEHKIKEVISCDFEIMDHVAGVRPTVRDRRPLVGSHSKYPLLHILNGLGTRGVMMGPSLASKLFQSINENVPLDSAIDISRFEGKC